MSLSKMADKIMITLSFATLIVLGCANIITERTAWQPTDLIHCRTNDDCHNVNHCCSITPALGRKRANQIPPDWDGTVHYCLPWKNENATWCELKLQYHPDTLNYYGLCPCGPGLICIPTDQLNPDHYPRDKFGKCAQV